METPVTTDEQKKMSLSEILSLMTMVDDGLLAAGQDEIQSLLSSAELKIDNYKYLLDKIDAETDRIGKKIKEFQEAKRELENKAESVKRFLCETLRQSGFSKFRGVEYKVSLRSFQSVKVKREPTVLDAFTRTKIEWNKKELAEALKAGNHEAEKIAEFEESISPIFSVNKGDL